MRHSTQDLLYVTAFTLILCIVLAAGCAVLGTSPEEQIKRGAETITSGANLTGTLLQRKKITVAQAKDYRAMMGTASAALDTSNATLVACRKTTTSTQKTIPDPCAQNISTDVNLALSILTQIESTLAAKAKE